MQMDIRLEIARRLGLLISDPSSAPQELRSYQTEALVSTKNWLEDPNGSKRAYIEHATGLGKTELFATMVSICAGLRSLIIVPTKALLEQTVRRVVKFTNGTIGYLASMSRIKNEDDEVVAVRGHEYHDVVVVTDESFKRYAFELARDFKPRFIVRDECHGSYSKPEQQMLRMFDDAVIIGFTATPDYLVTTAREDYIPVTLDNGQMLYAPEDRLAQTHYHTCLDRRPVRWGIEEGWLAPLAWGQIEFNVSLDKVGLEQTEHGLDYKPEELSSLLQVHWPFMIETITHLYKEGEYDLPNRQVFAVCDSVLAARQLADALKGIGVKAECVTGKTSDKERRRILSGFDAGEIKFVSSVMVLREGWNAENAEVCLMLRPTKSRVLYVQTLGRVLRLPKNGCFKCALAVDVHYQNTRFAPLSAPILFGAQGQEIEDGDILVGPRKHPRTPIESPYKNKKVKAKVIVVPVEFETSKPVREVFYTYQEACTKVRGMGVKDCEDYRLRYKEDPHLPSAPPSVYADQGWISWTVFLDNDFYSFEEARKRVKEMGIKSGDAYELASRRDPKLRSGPDKYYKNSGWVSWQHFLGKPIRATYEEACALVRSMGIKSSVEYRARFRENTSLPFNPDKNYAGKGWVSFPVFLGRSSKDTNELQEPPKKKEGLQDEPV